MLWMQLLHSLILLLLLLSIFHHNGKTMDENIAYLGPIMMWLDLNEGFNGPSFCNTFMSKWGTYWRYELQITQIFFRKVVRLYLKHGLVNDVGIAVSRVL
jgi:hypothetical protein